MLFKDLIMQFTINCHCKYKYFSTELIEFLSYLRWNKMCDLKGKTIKTSDDNGDDRRFVWIDDI